MAVAVKPRERDLARTARRIILGLPPEREEGDQVATTYPGQPAQVRVAAPAQVATPVLPPPPEPSTRRKYCMTVALVTEDTHNYIRNVIRDLKYVSVSYRVERGECKVCAPTGRCATHPCDRVVYRVKVPKPKLVVTAGRPVALVTEPWYDGEHDWFMIPTWKIESDMLTELLLAETEVYAEITFLPEGADVVPSEGKHRYTVADLISAKKEWRDKLGELIEEVRRLGALSIRDVPHEEKTVCVE
jgi:hypothetical protein